MQLGGTTTAATEVTPPQTNDLATTEAPATVGAFEVTEEMSDRGFGGNRWPQQETNALLNIRIEMGIAFRDSTVKGPLWEEVSRKMAELGYIRNAKKCKEKFENVYKYHKRTKEGRTGKSDGKTYRFFEKLEALEAQKSPSINHHQQQQPPSQPQPQPLQPPHSNNTSIFSTPIMPPSTNITLPSSSIPPYTHIPISGEFFSDNSTSSATSSDVEIGGNKKRKRKQKEFFERLKKQLLDKQEELQRKLLEAIEKLEHDRMVREEAWRAQEIARINREKEILAQERSMSAAKDATIISLLQKLSETHGISIAQPQPQQVRTQIHVNNNTQQTPQQQTPQPPPPPPQPTLDTTKKDNGDKNMMTPASASSSRWPKAEIEALIKLRTNLDARYEDNGPKGPLWEEISAGMIRLGFNRNSKRCKEKWENINKYFKKVKDSNKQRPEDSKTCPYYHQLDALYREKTIRTSGLLKPDNSVPLMVTPEQQWPPVITTTPPTQIDHHPQPPSQPMDQHFDDEGTDEEDDDEDDEEENEEEEGAEYELVPSDNNNTTVDG